MRGPTGEKRMGEKSDLTFGEELRRERLIRDVSLDEISASTKISVRLLTALESSDVKKLPAPVFTRGFIRAYSRHLGLDPDEMINAYLADVAPDRGREGGALEAARAESVPARPARNRGRHRRVRDRDPSAPRADREARAALESRHGGCGASGRFRQLQERGGFAGPGSRDPGRRPGRLRCHRRRPAFRWCSSSSRTRGPKSPRTAPASFRV